MNPTTNSFFAKISNEICSATIETGTSNSLPCYTVQNLDLALQSCQDYGGQILHQHLRNGEISFAIVQDPTGYVAILSTTHVAKAQSIEVIAARTNNLKNISVQIPLNKMSVITGVSGSGKSSLAYDTIYAEAQQRFQEAHDQVFFHKTSQPIVDFIHSLPPVIPVKQNTFSNNPRSTVGTLANISDLLRALFATLGSPHCPFTKKKIKALSASHLADLLCKLPNNTKVEVRSPIITEVYKTPNDLFEVCKSLEHDTLVLNNQKTHINDLPDNWTSDSILELNHGRLNIGKLKPTKLVPFLDHAFQAGGGFLRFLVPDSCSEQGTFYQTLGGSFPHIVGCPINPASLSFNTPSGACETCSGLGKFWYTDPNRIVIDTNRSLKSGPFAGQAFPNNRWSSNILKELSKAYKFDLDVPYKDLPSFAKDLLLHGTQNHLHRVDSDYFGLGHGFEGILSRVNKKFRQSSISDNEFKNINSLMSQRTCPTCHGKRTKVQRNFLNLYGVNFTKVFDFTLEELQRFLGQFPLNLDPNEKLLLEKLETRVSSLLSLGLGYLRISQPATSLSGGEFQRIKLSSQVGGGLINMLYVLDEPSVGLHASDKKKMIDAIHQLRDRGNTVVVVEHDEQIIRASDHCIELGPGAGELGGHVVVSGTIQTVQNHPSSKTGAFLSDKAQIKTPTQRRNASNQAIYLKGVCENNLNNIDVELPLGVLACVTGVSGSGKSTLINQVLGTTLLAKLRNKKVSQAAFDSITGHEVLDDVAIIDQQPIGKSSRSNPATYCGIFDFIRFIFQSCAKKAHLRLNSSHFSFNTRHGRCPSCRGIGSIKTNMPFLADIKQICMDCLGKRFNPEVLQVKYQNKDIVEVLDMTIREGIPFFADSKPIVHKLSFLESLGLGYLKLGHPATSLSGGEAQRIKLADELSKIKPKRKILYILDEPTTGLHLADIQTLLQALNRLIDAGNSVVVIEHHLDVIKSADYIIDLGPGGGPNGGNILAVGSPEKIIQDPASLTGRFLKKHLGI